MEQQEDSSEWNSKICESMVCSWWDGLRDRYRLSQEGCETWPRVPSLPPVIIKAIFTIGHILHQPSPVRYTTLEIFDRFIRLLFVQLRDYVSMGAGSTVPRTRQWARILARTRNQGPLRIMSCMQIASKLNSSTQALSPAVIQGFLQQIHQPFSRQSIMSSERRVLKTIGFQFGVSLCTYLQHLVGALQRLAPRPDPGHLYATAQSVLDLALVRHRWTLPPASSHPRCAPQFDHVLLSAAAVVCALIITDSYEDAASLALHRLTDLPMREVESVARSIMNVTQISSTPSPRPRPVVLSS